MLFGTAYFERVLGTAQASPLAVAADRIVLAGLVLLAGALAAGALRGARTLPVVPLLAAVAGAAGFQLTFFSAVDGAGVAVATVVSIGTAPLVTGLLARVLGQPAPPRAWYPATGLGLAGVVLLVGSSDGSSASGVWLAAAAGSFYAVYVVSGRALLDTGVDGLGVVAVVFAGAAAVMLPVALIARPGVPVEVGPLVAVAYLALGPTVVAYLLLARALASLPPASVVTLGLAEPLTGALLGLVVLREHLGAAQLCGAALVLGGLVVLTAAGSAASEAATPGPPLWATPRRRGSRWRAGRRSAGPHRRGRAAGSTGSRRPSGGRRRAHRLRDPAGTARRGSGPSWLRCSTHSRRRSRRVSAAPCRGLITVSVRGRLNM